MSRGKQTQRIKPFQHGIKTKFLLILAWLHMYALDESTFIFNRQEGCSSSSGNDNTLESFEKAEGESAGLRVILHPRAHLRCCCLTFPHIMGYAAGGDVHALKCPVTASPRKRMEFMEINRKDH